MRWILFVVVLLLTACGQNNEEIELPTRNFENRVGTVFTSLPKDILAAPTVEIIELQKSGNLDAIWGASGRDDAGNIYFGVSSHGGVYGSSFLYQYNPVTKQVSPQGETVRELKKNNVYREGTRQNKLHSKIYQANDGYLYFSSFDESGEAEDINPVWGGHLWRKLPDSESWEHVMSTEEALIAVNTNGRYVYALGYWNHVIYQYDTKTGTTARVVSGSVKMHVSRNFIVDEVGHVYVPSLSDIDSDIIKVSLKEYDTQLNTVAEYPLPSYQEENINNHHGIVGYTSMKNGDIYFTTSDGGLYLISPFKDKKQKIKYIGMMHPDGSAYIASLFTIDGEELLVGIGKRKNYEWIVYETTLDKSYTTKLEVDHLKGLSLFGSVTKSNNGDMYVVGRHKTENSYQPILLKINKKDSYK
ncbi:hypothetical protein [Vibrio ziniensis]|uniref:Lipoprotein n=1 Tax=Vibrio ziniensis TaxID=2711221 RepID=A0A6G7CNB5_9VIBR|nr:hypothetical protein [Vibrio ziniensis]QIH43560.1 hypothetical protein G5S32_16330 [Vibrio ziniensis]